MLKLIEFGLLAVSLLIIFGLVASTPRSKETAAPELVEAADTEIAPMRKL